jgi:hypothetical protein
MFLQVPSDQSQLTLYATGMCQLRKLQDAVIPHLLKALRGVVNHCDSAVVAALPNSHTMLSQQLG